MTYGTTKNNMPYSNPTPIDSNHRKLIDTIKLINIQFDCLKKVIKTPLSDDIYNRYSQNLNEKFSTLMLHIIDIDVLLTTLIEDLHTQLYIEDFIVVLNRMDEFIYFSEGITDTRIVVSRDIMITCKTALIRALEEEDYESLSTCTLKPYTESQGVLKKILHSISSAFYKLNEKLHNMRMH